MTTQDIKDVVDKLCAKGEIDRLILTPLMVKHAMEEVLLQDLQPEDHYNLEIDRLTEQCKQLQKRIDELKWIPLVTRPMTKDEKEHYTALERTDVAENGEIFDCPLPNDSQEVLVSHGGYVYIDTFYNDCDDGCYFESLNIDEVDAWMPLPVAFERKENAI